VVARVFFAGPDRRVEPARPAAPVQKTQQRKCKENLNRRTFHSAPLIPVTSIFSPEKANGAVSVFLTLF
jgi:hypothetical protein